MCQHYTDFSDDILTFCIYIFRTSCSKKLFLFGQIQLFLFNFGQNDFKLTMIFEFLILKYILIENGHHNTGGPRYMRTFYLQFCVYAIKITVFHRNISSNLPILLVSLYANSLYSSQF